MSHGTQHSSIGLHSPSGGKYEGRVPRFLFLRRAKVLGFILLIALLIGAAIVFFMRFAHTSTLEKTRDESAKVYVYYITPSTEDSQGALRLPGNLLGNAETQIYARISGYVTRWYKDIGDRVKKGDLLVELDTPEVQQQLSQARAARQQVSATVALARSSFARWQNLRKQDAVSQQEFDERQTSLKQGEANLAAAEADVQRLTQLLSYNRLVAPFNGVVTKRNVDVGNLVDVGNGGALKQLYAVAQIDPLRVYISVPQVYSQQIRPGVEAKISLAEFPGKSFTGKVVRTAGAIDPATRTMQVEIQLPNPDGKLLPGSFAEVTLQTVKAETATLTVPNNALLFRPEGTMVAVVQADNKVHLQKVSVGRDLGTQVTLQSGVNPQDRIIINPPDSLNEGLVVQATAFKPPKAVGAPTAPASAPSVPSAPSAPKSASASQAFIKATNLMVGNA